MREIHAEAIAQFGGLSGVRENALLESAVAAPQPSAGGQVTISGAAAACLYYLCRNHPLIDGNKRATLGACIVFLRLNGLEPRVDSPKWEELVMAIAAGTLDRDATTTRLHGLIR